MVEDDPVVIFNNPWLEYATLSSQPHWVSKTSNLPSNARPQHVNNTQPTLNNCDTENRNMFNIQCCCYESRLKGLSQETTFVLEWHKRTR